MAKATPKSIGQLSDKIQRRYEQEYAGLPRHTRSVEPLEAMIAKCRDLLRKAKKLKGEAARAVETRVASRLALYEGERDAIATARYEKPEVHEAHRASLEAQKIIDAYRRGFHGRPRALADVTLLDALIARLEGLQTHLRALLAKAASIDVSGALESVKTHTLLLKDERGEIDKAVRALDADGQRARWLALAQQALDTYRVHFAGHPRATCEPARLEAVVARLAEAQAALEGVEGVDPEAREVIAGSLETYRRELPAVRDARAAATPRELAGWLGRSANDISGLYKEHFAGQSRQTRNVRLLSDMLERLGSVHDQMAAVSEADPSAANQRNLGVIESNLRMYSAEWQEIVKAQAQAKSAGGPGITVQDAE